MITLFETPRLVVRQVAPGDADALLAIFGDPENTRFYGAGRPWSRADAERFLASYPAGDERLISAPGLALLRPALAVVGFGGVGYYRREGTTADLFFILRKEHWGRGLATELARAAIAAAFCRPEIGSMYATVRPDNRASARVLEKCGMPLQRHLPEEDRLLYRLDRG